MLRRVATLVLLLAPLCLLFVPAQAEAAAKLPDRAADQSGPQYSKPLGSFKITYKKTWTFRSAPLRRCVVFTASGNITYKVYDVGSYAASSYVWEKQKLNSPKITAHVEFYRNRKCGAKAKVTKLELGQHWTGYACSFNPSISVSYPWGISVGAWPSCGNRNQATYDTTYATRSTNYAQNNTGSPTAFGNYYDPEDANPPPCYGVFPSAVAYIGSTSDSYGASNISHSGEVCLSKT
jgi:hypothetical protein